ncbi:alveolar macrophage chemotactic factor-like [Brachionichthys hirsutus]|uniref:alveolar macrophage chemotactic factor-like n=1 Tax=Brachionichthys hirsutus TaxID=412623 RepID=UPI003604E342
MNPAVLAFLCCLLVFHVQGELGHTSGRCSCLKGYIDRVHPRLVKAGPVVHGPSIFCRRTEITVTLKNNKEKCINPQSELGRRILRK